MRLILASTSPRRREILALLGLPFEVIAPGFTEQVSLHRAIEDEVLDFAAGKASSVAMHHPESIVIGSDTMIAIDGKKIGKPIDHADAKQILCALSGKNHRILTAVAILDGLAGAEIKIVEEVSVKMRAYSDADIDCYLSCNESLDKAGAYSIQGAGRALIETIQGDYLAAVGMPLKPIADYLTSQGVAVPLDIVRFYSEARLFNEPRF